MACELSYINTAILVTFALQLSKSRQAVYTKWSIKSGQNQKMVARLSKAWMGTPDNRQAIR